VASALTVFPVSDIPEVMPGHNIASLIVSGLRGQGYLLKAHDVLVITQKIVSKSQNRFVRLANVIPSERAISIGREIAKDPRLVEVILSESTEIIAKKKGVIITRHLSGVIMANAGVDMSNLPGQEKDNPVVLMLPLNPDLAACQIRREILEKTGVDLGVIINDSAGRPWRNGVSSLAIGASGIPSLQNLIGTKDLFGRRLEVTQVALADLISNAASLVMGEGSEGIPVVLIRGLVWSQPSLPASSLQRPFEDDLFIHSIEQRDYVGHMS
jgi:coenzyme F420-0:L-glutamate ligase/coenzyme F420-1:gamma-L-glutamate ligase